MGKIDDNKLYSVTKFADDKCVSYGIMSGKDVKSVIGTATYDAELEMWFTPKATIGYLIEEV